MTLTYFSRAAVPSSPRFPATHVYPLPMHNPDPSALDHVGGGGVLMLIIMLYRASVSDVNDDSE